MQYQSRVIASGFAPHVAITLLSVLLLALPPGLVADPIILETATVELRQLDNEQRFDGVVEAVNKSTISAQTNGEILELPFDVNDFVPKGAVIVRLDDTQQKARLDRALANETKARARLAEVRSRHQRNLRLIKESAVSKSQLEKSASELKSAQAQLELSQAASEEARQQWEFTTVRAPYAGVVVERFVEVGEMAQAGKPLGTGLSLENLRVEVDVPAAYVNPIRASQRGRIQLPDAPESWLDASNITVFPYADKNSHTFTLRADLPEGQHGLYPGILVKVVFTVGKQTQLVVPSRAIVHRSEVTGVYVLDENSRIHFRQIREGHQIPGDFTIVLAGLDAGEQVALDPVAAGIKLKQQATGSGDE